MWNAGLDKWQAGKKIARRSINNPWYANNTNLMAESEEELKSLLMRMKEGTEKAGLKSNTKKAKITASGPIPSRQIEGKVGTVTDFIFSGSKTTADGDCSHEIKRCLLLGKKPMTNLGSILKSRDVTCRQKSIQSKLWMLDGGGNGNPLQCSCLENPVDRRAWWAAVYGVAQSRTRLKRLSSSGGSSMDVRAGPQRRRSTEDSTLSNCGFGEDSWESLGLQGNQQSIL